MAGPMQMNVEQVRQVAARVNAISGELRSMLSRLENSYSQYASDWKGNRKNSFDLSYSDLRNKINGLISQADSLSSGLQGAASSFSLADGMGESH